MLIFITYVKDTTTVYIHAMERVKENIINFTIVQLCTSQNAKNKLNIFWDIKVKHIQGNIFFRLSLYSEEVLELKKNVVLLTQ